MFRSRIALFAAATALLGGMATTGLRAEDEKKADEKKNPVVVLDTTLGAIHIELDAVKAPVTARNFVEYVEAKHYDGTIFHRVIPRFMIQGGGFSADMKEKSTRDPIKNEASNGLKNVRGSIAMARTPDPNSATAQFFINVKDNDALNHQNETARGFGYAVFGKVTKGMDVVDKIVAVPTGSKGQHEDVPLEPVVIKSATVQK